MLPHLVVLTLTPIPTHVQLKAKLPQLEASLFRNLAKHTCVNSAVWESGDAPPSMEPLNEDLARAVEELAGRVTELSKQVRDLRDSVMPEVGVQEFSEMLGAEPAHALEAAAASAHSGSARKRRRTSSSSSPSGSASSPGADGELDENGAGLSASGLGAQTVPELCTSDMLKRLKSSVDQLVTTTKTLRSDLPRCLDGSKRELRAAKQVLGSLSSNVDQAMMRPSFAAGPQSQEDSSSSSNSSQASADVDDELVSPKKAIRGIAAGSALRKRLAEESASSLA